MTITQELQDLSALSEDEALARVIAALREAATTKEPEQSALELDLALAEAILDTRYRDSLLSRIELGDLADLLERCTTRCRSTDGMPPPEIRIPTWRVLDLVRRSPVSRRIGESGATDSWASRILAAVEVSHFTVGALFQERAEDYALRVLFEIPDSGSGESMSWAQAAARVDDYTQALLSLDHPAEPGRVAIVSENRPEMALLDLACLTSGIVNVMVPANATDADVGYILKHSQIATAIVSGREQLAKVNKSRKELPELRHVVMMDHVDDPTGSAVLLDDLRRQVSDVPGSLALERAMAVRIDDLATIMYTSGTTGMPKGIQYSQRNLVFKRFARALALPEIGDRDVFLSYLPLFHTFGRYLEMMGSIFWGAKYCFLLDPSVEALLDGMRKYRPSVFISVPRKWIQLYEAITQRADPLTASDEEILAVTKELTGGRLAWGLSAAGHLDSEIFRFFHRQGIQVLSGFGMSEATGGITMTPPHQYKDNSLGVPLPGIEVRLEDDGELVMRGPYVMKGYLDPPDGEASFDEGGWFHSGDLMRKDEDGHIRIVDRKKEIYKNIKGQTIAPQRIENLFREFESVGRAFLVGDEKEYNTLLIYPNFESEEIDLKSLSEQGVQDHFRSLVASVNKFVAPFERVVDFAVIDRDLSADHGELTPKGTPRRKAVVENFTNVIDALYRRTFLDVGGVDLYLPNWMFQVLGLTARDVAVEGDELQLPPMGTHLTVKRVDAQRVQIGSCIYQHNLKRLNLGTFLATPRLWLGNEELIGFVPLDLEDRQRSGRRSESIEWVGCAEPYQPTDADRDRLDTLMVHHSWDLLDLDHAARMLGSDDEPVALEAVRLLERILTNEDEMVGESARFLLARGSLVCSNEVKRLAFQVLVPFEKPARFQTVVRQFLSSDSSLLDSETRAVLCERSIPESKIEDLLGLVREISTSESDFWSDEKAIVGLLQFLAEYGAAHPVRYRRIRAFLAHMSLFAEGPSVRAHADDARSTLQFGFWQWLGPTLRIAVDTETGQEYRWDDVVVLEEGTPEEERHRLLAAIKNTPFLREAVFLLYLGRVVRLSDIPPGGVWIRRVGVRHGKTVYRATIQTRSQESFEVTVNVNNSLDSAEVQDEIDWLIVCDETTSRGPVVETVGGHAQEQEIWSEEFIPGDTLDRELRRLTRRSKKDESLLQLWPFLAWSALSSYVDFWLRSGRRFELAELAPHDIVVPSRDYHRGSRIVTLPGRRPHESVLAMLRTFEQQFVRKVEAEYPALAGLVGWDVVFSAFLEVVGEQTGLEECNQALDSVSTQDDMTEALRRYVDTVAGRGFLPKRLYFAVKRYQRWAHLNQDATAKARASTLKELYDTYGLDLLAATYPEVRLRFFRETVFRGSSAELAQGLDSLVGQVREGELRDGELAGAVADLRQRLAVAQDDDYFLARIPFAYLSPEDSVDFVSTDAAGEYQAEIVVTLEDDDGTQFRVRHALLPREVERLHRLFLAARLDVRFGPEHRYLVAINDRDQIIGGIYYTVDVDERTAHLEKIVVAERYRRKGVADGLMNQFFNRLQASGVEMVTTGFFRPEYFYAYGFRIERRYAGLVKDLAGEQPRE